MKSKRTWILGIILLLLINTYVAINKAEEYAESYKRDRYISLYMTTGSMYLDVDSPRVGRIEFQGRYVWKKVFVSSFLKGVVFLSVPCVLLGGALLLRTRYSSDTTS